MCVETVVNSRVVPSGLEVVGEVVKGPSVGGEGYTGSTVSVLGVRTGTE